MSVDTLCPDPARVRQLMVGDLSESEAEAICEHVPGCPACTTILRNLAHEQTLLDAVRPNAHSWSADPDDRVAVEQLIARLQNPAARAATTVTSASLPIGGLQTEVDEAAAGSRSAVHLAALAQGLLRPPTSAGELGWLGSYRVLSELGSGGMGVVFEAEDQHLGRRVAVKAMLPALLGREEHKLRFLREARAAASIDHDNIVPIHQVGEDRGVPYFVMPLLKGESLESRLRREGRLSIAEAVRIGRQIAIGIAAAHERGLVHRDIKPANIWLEHRGPELPRVRILDFGLARNEDDDSQLTKTGAVAGTPAFMAPEQARGDRADARSDLFSVGCVLYCLLAGRPPFTGRNSAAMMYAILNHRPDSLDDLQPPVPQGLAALVMHLLQKDPAQRVESAIDVAEALRAIEDDISRDPSGAAGDSIQQTDKSIEQPILAAKPSVALDSNRTGSINVERGRFGSRNALVSATAFVLLAIGLAYAAIVSMRVETPYGTVVLEFDSQAAAGAEVSVDEQRRITLTPQPGDEPITLDVDSGTHQLKVVKPGFEIFTREFSVAAGGREQVRIRLEPKVTSREADAAGNAPATTEPATAQAPSALISGIRGDAHFPGLAPRPVRMAGLRRWQIETLAPRGDIFSVAWDRDGRRVACGSPIGNVRIIDVAKSKTLSIIPAHTGTVWAMDWSPVEDRIVTAGDDGFVRLFDSNGGFQRQLGSHAGTARSVAFSRDGSWIASGGFDSKVRLWRTTGEPGPVLTGHSSQVDGVAWHPSGQKLASASLDGTVRIWDLKGAWNTNGIRGQELKGHLGGVLGVSWSPDGELLASGGMDGAVVLWTGNGARHSTLSGHGSAVTAVTWGANGIIATSGDDKTVRLWQHDGVLLQTQKMEEVGRFNDLDWSRDGSQLAIATDRYGIRFLDQSGEWDGGISLDTASTRAIAFNSRGELAAAGDEGFVGIWSAEGIRTAQLEEHKTTVFSVSWNPGGSQFVSGSWNAPVRIWTAGGDAIETRSGTHPTAWSPTAEEVAWTSGPDVHVAGAGAPERVLRGHQSQVVQLKWNSSGTQLASADANGSIRVWNRDGSPAGAIQADPQVLALAWHPQKPLLASGSAGNGNIQLWGLDGNLSKTWNAHVKGITALEYSPDGQRLFSSAYDQQVRVWNDEGHAVGAFPGPMAIVCAIAWNATGREIATAHIDGAVCLWDESTFEPKATTVIFNDGNWARIDSQGISNSSDPAAVDQRFVVVAEDESGMMGLMTISDFRERKTLPGD